MILVGISCKSKEPHYLAKINGDIIIEADAFKKSLVYDAHVNNFSFENQKHAQEFIQQHLQAFALDTYIYQQAINDQYIKNTILTATVAVANSTKTTTFIDRAQNVTFSKMKAEYSSATFAHFLNISGQTAGNLQEKIRKQLISKMWITHLAAKSIIISDNDIETYYKNNLNEFVHEKEFVVLRYEFSSQEKAKTFIAQFETDNLLLYPTQRLETLAESSILDKNLKTELNKIKEGNLTSIYLLSLEGQKEKSLHSQAKTNESKQYYLYKLVKKIPSEQFDLQQSKESIYRKIFHNRRIALEKKEIEKLESQMHLEIDLAQMNEIASILISAVSNAQTKKLP